MGNNLLSSLKDLAILPCLEEFWASGNKLESFTELQKLRQCPKLIAVYLDGNPWCQNPRYVAIVREALPNLQQIDAMIIKWA